ncbi:dihydrofolate reductase [Mycetocola miduiensis]|uniref:Dihydrofolate reductase n=1 Tax=Mycetocola miduiensis TaxID=995034 RepID=A0A1I5BJ19_9MICO|nr:dihydrofolate reductase [Mycetocola miduiensis]SFN74677.1 dihydrofolate reductase [Mycetocola miduiensis]
MTLPRVGLVWAEAANGTIGKDGVLPWHLPEDLAHFKAVTLGSAVVMGRKTWLSLPERFRPLPGRRNIVITRQPDWKAPGAEVSNSLASALQLAAEGTGEDDFVWVIGGAEVFSAVIDIAHRLEVTSLRVRIEGDAVAPAITERWRLVASDPEEGWHTSATGIEYRFQRYES